MKRSLSFVPLATDLLELRVVLSQIHPVVATAAKSHHKVVQHHVAATPALIVQGVTQETFSTGLVKTTHRVLTTSGNGQAIGQDIVTNSDGSSEVDFATGTLANGVTRTTISKQFSNGTKQSEVDLETTTTSFGTLQADGTVIPGSPKSGLIATTKFNRVTTQAGLGTQAIVGSTLASLGGGHDESITKEQVTHFDGTVDQVEIVTQEPANSAVENRTTTTVHADGTSVTTTSTIKILSGSID